MSEKPLNITIDELLGQALANSISKKPTKLKRKTQGKSSSEHKDSPTVILQNRTSHVEDENDRLTLH